VRRGLVVLVAGACGSTPKDGPVCVDPPRGEAVDWFEDVTPASGIDFVYATDAFKGGALGVGDLDGDGLPEIVASSRLGGTALFQNLGGLRFASSGVSGLEATFAGSAVAIGDLDGDGDRDLVLGGTDLALVLANDGAGHFTEVARWTGAGRIEHLLPVDLDRDGLLDIFVSTYDTRGGEASQNRLYMNRGAFTFASTTLDVTDLTWTASAFDADGDGDLDLYLANDTLVADHGEPLDRPPFFPPDRLLRNDGVDGDGMPVLTDVAADAGLTTPRSSMGGLVGDLDRDGALDLFIPDYGPNKLFARDGAAFVDRAPALGLAPATRRSRSCPDGITGDDDCILLSWSGAVSDFDVDGHDELLVTNGDTGSLEVPPVQLFTRDDAGMFVERATSIPCGDWRTAIAIDLDRDGDEDVLIAPKSGPLATFETRGTPAASAWLRVSLRGSASNRDGAGAIVRVELADGRTFVHAIGASGVIHAALPAEAWFGVGAGTVATVRVMWPSGRESVMTGPVVGDVLIEEGPP